MEKEKSSLAVPLSIVIAGGLIAVAVYFSGSGGNAPVQNNVVGNNVQAAVGTSKMDIRPIRSSDHIVGNPNAPIILIEYSDTECPYCKQFHNSLQKVMSNHGKDGSVAWVYRHFPLEALHKKAKNEAKATECAAKLGGNEKFWTYIDRLFQITPSNDGLDAAELPKIATYAGLSESAFNTCLKGESTEITKIIDTDYQEAIDAGGNGTPFTIIVSQKKFDGEKMKASITDIANKYGIPYELFFVSDDNMKVSVSGAMSYEIMEDFVQVFKAL